MLNHFIYSFYFCLIPLSSAQTGTSPDCTHERTSFHCVEYVRNYDADTLTVNIANVHPYLGEKALVRVKGIDSPEIRGQSECEKTKARTAKKLVENLLKRAKRIDLVNIEKEKYGRILADVWVDGQNLKSILLKNSLAYAYEGQKKPEIDWCKRLPASVK